MKAHSPKVAISAGQRLAECVFWPARILLLAMIFASPWYYGSVTWQAQTFYWPLATIILLLAVVGSMLRKEAVANPLVWSVTALLLLALLQTVQLPEWLWQSVSTSAAFERVASKVETEFLDSLRLNDLRLNDLRLNDLRLDDPSTEAQADSAEKIAIEETPRTLSIHWMQTRASISLLAVVLACLISSGLLFRTRHWEVVLLSVLAVSGLCIAMLGLVQSVAWNKWTLLPMPTPSYFATFVSRNSAPQFLAIGLGGVLGVLAWWNSLKSDDADKKYYVRYPAINALARFRRRLEELVTELDALSLISLFAATLIFVAILAAGSRGGILSCLASAVLTLCVSLGTKKSYARSIGLLASMGCGAMLLLTTLELDSAIWERMDSVNEEAYKLNNGRFTVWQMILSEPSCWIPGCGLGNFHFAILPTYRNEPMAWFYHAENIYIELLAELGVIGFAIGMAGIVWLLLRIRWCVVSGRHGAPTFVATTLAVSAVGLQNLVDFSLILPAICLPLAALVGCFLGRSYCADFGKQPRQGEHRKTDQRRSSRHESARTSSTRETASASYLTPVGLFSLVVFCFWLTAKPLAGYAFAENLSTQLSKLEKGSRNKFGDSATQLIESIDAKQAERFADHPEVNLQIGRLLQAFAGGAFAEQLPWPAEMSAQDKATLSEPASIAAAYRAKNDTRMLALRKLTDKLPQQIEALRRSARRMAAAASVCSFDWRCQLGVVRSDLDWFAPATRARNYARLSQVIGQSSQMSASIGSAALLAGEKQVGYRFLHDYLARVPSQVLNVASSLVRQAPSSTPPKEVVKELQLILPDSPLIRAELAENFSRTADLQAISKELVSNLDLAELFAEAEVKAKAQRGSKPWLLVAWLARERLDPKTQIDALVNANNADPMHHEMRFELAKLLAANGRKSEAIQQAERASRQSPETRVYKDFLEKTRSKLPTD